MERVEGGAPLHHGYQRPEQPEKWYTPDSSAPQPGHLLPGCLPKREVSLCSRRGELRTPPPAWRSQCFPLRKGEAPFPSPGLSTRGVMLCCQKEKLGQCARHRAQLPRGAPLETSGREGENFTELTGYMEKFGWSFWCARLGGNSCT